MPIGDAYISGLGWVQDPHQATLRTGNTAVGFTWYKAENTIGFSQGRLLGQDLIHYYRFRSDIWP